MRLDAIARMAAACAACLVFLPLPAKAELEFESSGGTYFQYYLTQDNRFSELPPGYRFAFSIDNLIYRTSRGHFFVDLSNATVISRNDTAAIKLDKIRYRIDPGFRLVEPLYEANFLLSHECIHEIDRGRAGGSIFWNSLQLNFGTKGAYDHNLVDRVVHRDFQLRNSLDFKVGADAYLFGDAKYFIAQNHEYRARTQALIRYNWALWKKSAFYADIKQEAWLTAKANVQSKGGVQLNWILLSRKSVGVLYTEYTYIDQNPFDNENALWSLGLRILY
jgi:hypothetical protein